MGGGYTCVNPHLLFRNKGVQGVNKKEIYPTSRITYYPIRNNTMHDRLAIFAKGGWSSSLSIKRFGQSSAQKVTAWVDMRNVRLDKTIAIRAAVSI